ncbi:MAG: hypothetical protein WCI51_04065 [Lentisphaerota bacterium]
MNTKIFRSPDSNYYNDDISSALEVYNEDYLSKLYDNGFNAIWLRAILRDIASTTIFPELGRNSHKDQEILKKIIHRCAEFNIKVYLYFNEPLTFPAQHQFWENHPNLRGTPGSSPADHWKTTWALCTSHKPVLDFLYQGMNNLFTNCPGLGGVFLITRSEHHTNCYSHHNVPTCPLCSKRNMADVISEVINSIASGIYAASNNAEVIAWNWEWPADIESEIVSKINRRVIIMGDFERGGYKFIAGKERLINEYALSYVGPSNKFSVLCDECLKKGIRVYAKLQIGTTHELATVRNLPLIPNLLRKLKWLKNHNIQGALCCWNFGNQFSLNTYAFKKLLEYDLNQDEELILSNIASEYFGEAIDTVKVLMAWRIFVEAFEHYPFCVSFLYKGPINYVLRYPFPQPESTVISMQKSWLPLEVLGTKLKEAVNLWQGEDMSCEATEGQFDLQTMTHCLKILTERFDSGLLVYDLALSGNDGSNAVAELKNAKIIGAILKSVYYTFAAYQFCDADKFETNEWLRFAAAECHNLQKTLPLLINEKEIGFHSEAQDWFFTEKTVREKLNELKKLISHYKNSDNKYESITIR